MDGLGGVSTLSVNASTDRCAAAGTTSPGLVFLCSRSLILAAEAEAEAELEQAAGAELQECATEGTDSSGGGVGCQGAGGEDESWASPFVCAVQQEDACALSDEPEEGRLLSSLAFLDGEDADSGSHAAGDGVVEREWTGEQHAWFPPHHVACPGGDDHKGDAGGVATLRWQDSGLSEDVAGRVIRASAPAGSSVPVSSVGGGATSPGGEGVSPRDTGVEAMFRANGKQLTTSPRDTGVTLPAVEPSAEVAGAPGCDASTGEDRLPGKSIASVANAAGTTQSHNSSSGRTTLFYLPQQPDRVRAFMHTDRMGTVEALALKQEGRIALHLVGSADQCDVLRGHLPAFRDLVGGSGGHGDPSVDVSVSGRDDDFGQGAARGDREPGSHSGRALADPDPDPSSPSRLVAQDGGMSDAWQARGLAFSLVDVFA